MKVLLPIAGFLVLAMIVVYWPGRGSEPDLAPPLTIEQAERLPDDRLAAALMVDLAARQLRSGQAPDGWHALPSLAQAFWVSEVVDADLLRGDILTFLAQREAGAPGLADVRAACTSIGIPGVEVPLGEAQQIASSTGAAAVAACRAEFARTRGRVYARPPGLVDPFADCSRRVRAAVGPGIDAARIAFARRHLAEILAR